MDIVTSSTFSRYRQTPILLKRANAHALRRELSTSVLAISFDIFGDLSEDKNPKVDVHPICPLQSIFPYLIGMRVNVQQYGCLFPLAKIYPFLDTSKRMS